MLVATFFGTFRLSVSDTVSLRENELSFKLLSALAYLTANVNKRIPIRRFAHFLHEGKNASYSAASDSLVKTTLHRVRGLLAPLQAVDEKVTLICRDGGIFFLPDMAFSSDADQFDALYASLASMSDAEKAADLTHLRFCYERLFSLYRGEYLPFMTGDDEIIARRAQYRADYLALCEDYFALLLREKDYACLIEKASEAIAIDPYCEAFHYYKILAFMEKGDEKTALLLLESVETLLRNRFSINPSARLRALKVSLSPLGEIENASHALTLLERLDSPLSVEAFAALLRYFESDCRESGMTFALVKTDAHATPSLLAALLPIAPKGAALTQLSDTAIALLFENGRAESLRIQNALSEKGFSFAWDERFIGRRREKTAAND